MIHFKFTAIIILFFSLVLLPGMLLAQELTDAEKAQANNPLANFKALNFHYYYRPEINEVEGAQFNTFWVRVAFPTGRILWRASMPVETRFVRNQSTTYSESGFGDIDVFGAYLISMNPKFSFGIGPDVAFNTATDDALGSGKTSVGLAAVLFAVPNPQFQTGALIVWKTSVAGDDNRPDVNALAIQPFFFWQLGKGLYFRSVPIWSFDLESGHYHVPMSMGTGKVIKIGSTVFNFFMELQPSILVWGAGQPTFQVFSALNMQF